MKKLFSISFTLLILLSGMHFSIATHYCGDEIAATKASFTGELATCGMEGPSDQHSTPGNQIENHCCDNSISVFAVDQNYAPSFTEFTSFAQTLLQVFIVPVNPEIHSLTAINLNSTDSSPPENILVHAVSLPKICVFLI